MAPEPDCCKQKYRDNKIEGNIKYKIEKIPKEVLKKAIIVDNIFDKIKRLKKYFSIIELITSEESMNFSLKDKKIQKVLADIYEISHIAGDHCDNKHGDWVKKWDKIIIELEKDKQI